MKSKVKLITAVFITFVASANVSAQSQQSDRMITLSESPWQADQGDGYYMNPILKGDWGDPTVLRVGKDYYMTNHTATQSTPSMLIWHSRDLVNWKPLTYALTEDFGSPVWAADFIKHGELYYIYLPVPDRGTVYVITAKDPAGPWSKPVDVGVSGIDPGHIATPDGKRYLHVDAGYMVELSADGLKAVTPKKLVYEGWQYPKDWIVECFCLESPKLTYRNGWYYMTVAQGGTAGPPTGHMITASRSRTPYGPWEHSPYNPIVKTPHRSAKWASMGHGTLVDTPEGEWYIIFHAYENKLRSMGRQVLMLPVEWTADGWYKILEGIDPAGRIRKPLNGSKVDTAMRLSDDFEGTELGLQWKLIKGDSRKRVTIGNGILQLKAEGNSPSDSHPLVIDPVNDFYQVEVTVQPSEKIRSGLVLYAGTSDYLGLEVDGDALYRLAGGDYHREKITDISHSDVIRLRLSQDHGDLLYWYSKDGGNTWKRIDFVNNLNYFGGMTIRPGIYASGTGNATFRNFSYKGIK